MTHAAEIWAGMIGRHGHGSTRERPVPTRERAREMLLMGLRLTEGIDATRFEARTGLPLDDALDPDALARALEEDYLHQSAPTLAATIEGRRRLDALPAALVL